MPNNAQKHYHREKMARKYEECQNLEALVAEWEPFESNSDINMAYVARLRRKLRRRKIELINMGGEI